MVEPMPVMMRGSRPSAVLHSRGLMRLRGGNEAAERRQRVTQSGGETVLAASTFLLKPECVPPGWVSLSNQLTK